MAAEMGRFDDLPLRMPGMRRAGDLQACAAFMPDGASLRASQPIPAQRAVERSAHQPAACATSSAPWMNSEKKGLEIYGTETAIFPMHVLLRLLDETLGA